MTGLLKETFTEQAEAAEERGLDLQAILESGERRLRRQRVKRAALVVAAAVAVVATGLTAHQLVRPGDQVANGFGLAFTERRATYATGDKIHYGADVLELGEVRATAFVQTDAGFVLTDRTGAVYVADGRTVRQIGRNNRGQRLAADVSGTLAGWVDAGAAKESRGEPDRTPEFVVYDVGAGRELTRTPIGNKPGPVDPQTGPRVSAIDGDTAYFAASDGLYRWDLGAGEGRLLRAGVEPGFLYAARNGQLYWDHSGGQDVAMAARLDDPKPRLFEGWRAAVSPTGRYLLTDKADQVRLFEVASGNRLPLSFDGYLLVVPTQYSGDDTVYAIGFRSEAESEPVDLVRCSVKAGSCTPLKKAVAPGNPPAATFQLPIGVPLDVA